LSSSAEPSLPRRLLLVILLLGVATRLVHVDEPIFGFRPADTAAVARNFYENGMDIVHPQIDWRGNSPGYVESEFPIYSYVIALLYHVFGVHDAVARGVSIGLYLLSGLLVYDLGRRLFEPYAALLAVAFYTASPLGYYYTRLVQPDVLLALGSLAAIDFFLRWSEDGKSRDLMLSGAGLALAALIKPISLYLGLPLLYLAHRRHGWSCLAKPSLWLYALVVLVLPILWFRHSYQLWLDYGNTFGIFGGWVKVQAFPPHPLSIASAARHIVLRIATSMATPAGLLFLLAGCFARPPRGNYLLHAWAVGFAVAVVFTAKGMIVHEYYQLPLLFPLSLWMAYGARRFWDEPRHAGVYRRLVAALCVAVVAFGAWQSYVKIRVPPGDWNRVAFAARVRELTQPDALVIMVRPFRNAPEMYQHRTAQGEYLECDPQDFYRARRIGWSLDERLATPAFVDTLRRRGARYFATAFPQALDRQPGLRAALDERYTPVEVNDRWAIYRLDSRGDRPD